MTSQDVQKVMARATRERGEGLSKQDKQRWFQQPTYDNICNARSQRDGL